MGEANKTYYLATLGCPKNEIDSEALEADLIAAGLTRIDDSRLADLIIVNSCGFINDAKVESVHTVLDLHRDRRPDSVLALCGCLPARYNLARSLDEVDIFLPWNKHNQLLGRLRERGWFVETKGAEQKRLTPKAPFCYLRISEGCSNRCAYCAIPDIKGPFRSRPLDDIVSEAEFLCAGHTREIILIGQDTTLYGNDLGNGTSLVGLLSRLENCGCEWIRLMYAHPAHLKSGMIAAMAGSDKVVRYIDLPLQHINPRVLKRMNRRVTRRQVETLIEELRARIPRVAIRTTFIVGFPGETDEEFGELLDFCESVQFDYVGIFKYSPEDGTPAYKFRDRIDEPAIEDRYSALLDVQNVVSTRKQKARLRTREKVLVQAIETDGRGYARASFQAPEVDGQVIIEKCGARPGQFIDVVFERCDAYDLFARQVEGR